MKTWSRLQTTGPLCGGHLHYTACLPVCTRTGCRKESNEPHRTCLEYRGKRICLPRNCQEYRDNFPIAPVGSAPMSSRQVLWCWQTWKCIIICYSVPVGERSIAISLSVCVSVCLSTTISLEPLGRSPRIFCADPCGHGSALLWWRCDTLCTSGFMDDVTFCSTGHRLNLEPLTALQYRGGVWCLWMPYCYYCC